MLNAICCEYSTSWFLPEILVSVSAEAEMEVELEPDAVKGEFVSFCNADNEAFSKDSELELLFRPGLDGLDSFLALIFESAEVLFCARPASPLGGVPLPLEGAVVGRPLSVRSRLDVWTGLEGTLPGGLRGAPPRNPMGKMGIPCMRAAVEVVVF